MLAAHRKAHRVIWRVFALLIPAILLVGWFARPLARVDLPQRLAPPQDAPSNGARK